MNKQGHSFDCIAITLSNGSIQDAQYSSETIVIDGRGGCNSLGKQLKRKSVVQNLQKIRKIIDEMVGIAGDEIGAFAKTRAYGNRHRAKCAGASHICRSIPYLNDQVRSDRVAAVYDGTY